MTSIVLVCAVLASLAAGVLLAYMICHLMFELFQTHARQIAQATRRSVSGTSDVAQISSAQG